MCRFVYRRGQLQGAPCEGCHRLQSSYSSNELRRAKLSVSALQEATEDIFARQNSKMFEELFVRHFYPNGACTRVKQLFAVHVQEPLIVFLIAIYVRGSQFLIPKNVHLHWIVYRGETFVGRSEGPRRYVCVCEGEVRAYQEVSI